MNSLASLQRVEFPPYETRPKSLSFQQPLCYTFQAKCCFRRSRLFIVHPYKASNLFSDYYLNNLTSLQRVQLPLYQSWPKSSRFQPICYNQTKCSFRRYELFIANHYKANNLFSDDYMNSLATHCFQQNIHYTFQMKCSLYSNLYCCSNQNRLHMAIYYVNWYVKL